MELKLDFRTTRAENGLAQVVATWEIKGISRLGKLRRTVTKVGEGESGML